MYKGLLVLLSVVGMATATFAQQKQDMNSMQSNHKVLVAYFSATGVTAQAAQKVADATGGEVYAITPAKPYTDADLDWRDKQSRSSVEMIDAKARPEIKAVAMDVSKYDFVFLGYPIWWDLAPRTVNTFIETTNLAGKTVIPFATSGGSSIGNSVAVLKQSYPNIKWQSGKLLNRVSEKEIETWVATSMK